MPDYTYEGETAVDDFIGSAPEGFASATALNDMVSASTVDGTDYEWESIKARLVDLQGDFSAGPGAETLAESTDAVDDAVNNGIVPPSEAWRFFSWLLYTAGVLLIPTAGTYAFVEGYVTKWAQTNGWATLVGPVEPTPAVQALTQSLEVPPPGTTTAPGTGTTTVPAPVQSPAPLPVVPLAPVPLPTPSIGQTTTVGASVGVAGHTVTGGVGNGVTAAQVSASLAATAVDVLEVTARVFDAFLPGMAPGQVPEALSQLNRTVSALENQMSMVRNGIWPRGFVGLQEAFNGAAQALNGIAQEVNILHDQMAEKADSSLEDSIGEVSAAVGTLTGAVGTITGTDLPAIDSALSTVSDRVGTLSNTVTSDIEPRLATVENEATKAAASLALTTDDCLAQLCSDQANVTDPITEGGANPSLLKTLGNILQKGFEFGLLATLADAVLTILDANAVVTAVVKDTATIEKYAVGAAAVIEADFGWSGGLDISLATTGS
jgi:hypothetical protein